MSKFGEKLKQLDLVDKQTAPIVFFTADGFFSEEFVGHSSTVTCAALGHKSGRVMATAGEDGKVNLWHVGSPNCILSLSPLPAAVQTVRFNATEELVCAGSLSGAIRIWDLDAAKVVRHLSGHKASVRAVDFHPYGEFVVSGSDDHKVRMWDVRRKGCIFTYKGHENSISDVQFSPDGRWIASASLDGTCKLWDITAGKLLHELKDHGGALTSLQFHPREFLLATGSTDKTCKVYDVEQFRLISSTLPESNAIQKILFDESGDWLYTASQDYCKVFLWEPRCQHLDTVAVKWGKPADITISAEQLMGCSFNQNVVSVYIVDLKSIKTEAARKEENITAPSGMPQPAYPQSRRTSNVTTRPHTSCGVPANDATFTSPHANAIQCNNNNSESYIKAAEIPSDPEKVFKPTSTLPRSPVKEQNETAPPEASKPPAQAKHQTNVYQVSKSDTNVALSQQKKATPRTKDIPVSIFENPKKPNPQPTLNAAKQKLPRKEEVQEKPANVRSEVSESKKTPVATSDNHPPIGQSNVKPPLGGALQWHDSNQIPTRDKDIPEKPGVCDPVTPTEPKQQIVQSSKPLGMSTVIPSDRQDPVNLDVNAFLPPKRDSATVPTSASNDKEAITNIRKGFESMRVVLTSRHKNLEVVRALWTSGDVMTSINAAVKMNDQALVVDILNILVLKPSLWSLDLCGVMLPEIQSLITSKYETYMNVGCNSLKLVLKNFAQVIRANMKTPPSSVDISREERHKKCKACYEKLAAIRDILESKQQTSGKIGSQFRELKILISTLE